MSIDMSNVGSGFAGYDYSAFGGVGDNTIQEAARVTNPGRQYGLWTTLGGVAAGGVLDLADTVASSIPGITRLTGLERGDVNNKALAMIGSPGMTEFFNRNKDAIEMTSGIYGLIAAEFATRGLVKIGAPFAQGLKTAPYARRMFNLEAQHQAAMQSLRLADEAIALKGFKGASEFTAAMTVPVQSWGRAGLEMGERLVTRASLVNQAQKFGALKNVQHALATEAVMGLTLNSNNFLYPDDWGMIALNMGLGLAVPGLVGAVQTNYAIKTFVQSDHLNRLRAGALDPTGLESRTQNTFGKVVKGAPMFLGGLRGVFSDEATNYFTQASARAADTVDASTYNQLSQRRWDAGFNAAEKVTQSGLLGVRDSAFKIKAGVDGATPAGRTIKAAARADSNALLGVEMAGLIDREVGTMGTHLQVQDHISKRIEFLKKQLDGDSVPDDLRIAAETELKQLHFAKKTIPQVLMPDGERLPMSYAAAYDDWVEPRIQQTSDGLQNMTWEAFDKTSGNTKGLGLDQDLNIFISGKGDVNARFANLSIDQMLNLHRMAGKAVKQIAQNMLKDGKLSITLSPNANWLQLDMADEILELTQGRAKINFPNGMSRESAQVESLAQKVDALKARGINMRGAAEEVARARIYYNLPKLTAHQMGVLGSSRHPLDVLVRGAMSQGGGDALRQMTAQEIKLGWTEAKHIDDLSSMSTSEIRSLKGDSFNFLLDDTGEAGQPVLVYSRPLKPHNWTRDDLAERIAIHKYQQMQALTGTAASNMIREITAPAYMSADMAQAARINEMSDLSLAPSTPGLANVAPSSPIGAAMNSVQSASWRARAAPTLQAVTRLREGMQQRAAAYAKRMFDGHLGDKLDRLAAPNMLESNTLLDQYFTPGVVSGWDLEERAIPVPGPQGKNYWGFVLKDTEANKARFSRQFGREMTQGEGLIGPTGKRVVLDDLGLDIVDNGIQPITDDQLLNTNTIRRAGGLGDVERRVRYVVPPDLSDKFIAITTDASGRTVEGGMIIARSEDALKKQMALAVADPDHVASRPGNIMRTQQELHDYGTVWDRAQMSMMDANENVLKGGKHQQGLNAVGGIVPGSFKSALEQLRNNYLNTAQDALEIALNDQVKMAKHRSHLAKGESKSEMSGWKGMHFRSSYDYWLQELRGTSPLANPGSPVGRVYGILEGFADKLIGQVHPPAATVYHALTDWATKRMPWTQEVADKAAFEKMATHLGDFMPFRDVDDMLMKRGFNVKPPTTADMTRDLSRFTAMTMLRLMEPAAALMNMAGVVNTMPAVIRQFSQRAGETVEQYAARVGHSSTLFIRPDGGASAVVDIAKLSAQGIKSSFKPDAWMQAFQKKTAEQGIRGQSVYELQHQMQAIESVPTWKKFFVGDPRSTSKFGKKGVVGWMSVLTDESENFSRAISLDVGAYLGRQMGMTVDQAIPFAHDFANRMIANYSPHNRPEIFQGAIGTPIGLFQSYMQNFYERMFRYIETGDYRAAAIQTATQGTLFGAVTVPGMDAYQQLLDFTGVGEGQNDPFTNIVGRFGEDAGDLLFAGTLSNLPKLLGAEGLALYARGDTAARLPGFSEPAGIAVIRKLKDGVTDAMRIFSDRNPEVTTQQLGEILSNLIPNRPLAGMAETLLAGGKDTDSYGQLVTENLSWMESIYRSMGLRSVRQQKELEIYYKSKQAQEIKASADEILREGSRSLIRAKGEDALPALFETYMYNGGDASNFTRWYRENFEAATETRGERAVDKVMRDPDKMRTLDLMLQNAVGVSDEASEEDPFEALTGPDPMDNANPTNDVGQASVMYEGLQ